MAERSDHSRIPVWVLAEIEAWLATGQSGDLHLTSRAGIIRHIRREELVLAPPQSPRCPACEKPMKEEDYGNLFICSCGVKRTRAQLARPEK